MAKIEEEKTACHIDEPKNLEEQAISLVGTTIYEKLVKGYTAKQWGKPCKELPAFIIRRLPVRFTYDNNYFNDRYQGIPIGGYAQIIEKMLSGAEVRLDCDFFDHPELRQTAKAMIYTGPIDRYFDYKFGSLEYRSVRFDTEVLDTPNYQGNAVVNYTDSETLYTRIIEHKHFEFDTTSPKTVISREYSDAWKPGDEPYYPINNGENNALYEKYKELAESEQNVIFGGRLGQYRYYDMDDVIAEALKTVGELK